MLLSISLHAKDNIESSYLYLYTDKTESVLGRPIRVEIYAVSLKSKISNLKLSPLSKDFGVEVDHIINNTTDERWPNKSVQVLKLKLYPRKSGKLIIPNLSIEKIQSKYKVVFIKDNNTSKNTVSLSSPYERQQIFSHFTVTSLDSSARLSINNKSTINGFDSTPLHFKRSKNKDGSYLLQIGWSLSAIKSGIVNLELPPIDYSVSGVKRKKFYLPVKKIFVKALPLYISPTTPIGKITILSNIDNSRIFKTNSLSSWTVKVKGTMNNAYNLPPVLRQIKSNTQFEFLPVNSHYLTESSENNIYSTVVHTIPFKALKSGFLTLPQIQTQYFDPNDGKLKTIFHRSSTIFILGNVWRSILAIFLFTVFFYLLKISNKNWKSYIYSKSKLDQAIKNLQQNGIINIRESINLIAESEFWPKNMSLSQWAKCWGRKYNVNKDFYEFMQELSNNIYSNNSNGKQYDLHSKLLNLVNTRKRIKKLFL